MSEEKKNVGVGTKKVVQVEIERKFWTWRDERTGVERESKGIQISFSEQGEDFKLRVDDKETRLLQFILRMQGYPLVDKDGNIVKEL